MPLNTRPLTVLSMIYRLWAGMRLEEAIRWQELWERPCAFGFRPAQSALDALDRCGPASPEAVPPKAACGGGDEHQLR